MLSLQEENIYIIGANLIMENLFSGYITITALVIVSAISLIVGAWIIALGIKGVKNITTNSGTQPTTKTGQKNLGWEKWTKVVLLTVGAVAVIYGIYNIPWKKIVSINYSPPENSDIPSETTTETLSLDRIFNDFVDYMENSFGQDAPVLLSIIGILVLTWIIGAVYTAFTKKTAKDVLELGVSGWLIILVLFVFGIKQVFFEEDKNKIIPEVKVLLGQVGAGGSVSVPMSLNTEAVVYIDMTNPRRDGKGTSFWACPEALEPEKLKDDIFFEVVTKGQRPDHRIRITKKSQELLLGYGVMRIKVKFTKILAGNRPEDNPCKQPKK